MYINPNAHYDLGIFVPASTWLIKSDLIERVGKWKFFKEIYDIPSQDWIRRAYINEAKISCTEIISMIAIQSGNRRLSYKNKEFLEHKIWFEKLIDPDKLRIEILTKSLKFYVRKDRLLFNHLKSFFKNLTKRMITKMEIRPSSIRLFLKYFKRGGFINQLREFRGLDKK
jgi:hypothetical protein